jgi:serine/threonine-protein kinase RsbW
VAVLAPQARSEPGARDKPLVLRLRVPNSRAELEPARLAVAEFLGTQTTDAKATYVVELALEETLMNVIWHGFTDEDVHFIDLTVTRLPNSIELCFEDDGRPFDPTVQTFPNLPTNLEQARPGGFGLLLVRKLAKTVRYQRFANRNQLVIGVAMPERVSAV